MLIGFPSAAFSTAFPTAATIPATEKCLRLIRWWPKLSAVLVTGLHARRCVKLGLRAALGTHFIPSRYNSPFYSNHYYHFPEDYHHCFRDSFGAIESDVGIPGADKLAILGPSKRTVADIYQHAGAELIRAEGGVCRIFAQSVYLNVRIRRGYDISKSFKALNLRRTWWRLVDALRTGSLY